MFYNVAFEIFFFFEVGILKIIRYILLCINICKYLFNSNTLNMIIGKTH
jgi:hypothetical protein